MKKIADETGGIFVSVDNIDQLENALKNATYTTIADRHLFGYRRKGKLGALYVILRILFLTIMGMFLGTAATYTTFYLPTVEISLISTIIKSIIGAVLMELGIQVLSISAGIQWFILWILFALLISLKPETGRTRGTNRNVS